MRDCYNVKDLGYAVCFEEKDKFLVGPINNKGTKIKDIKSGEIIEFWEDSNNFGALSSCSDDNLLAIMNGVSQVRGLETSLYDISIMQRAHAKQIRGIINKGIISTRDVATIKSIMNSEIETSQRKNAKRLKTSQFLFGIEWDMQERKAEKKNRYALSKEEKEF